MAGQTQAPSVPPLLGDGQGRYRIHVVGNSGSGKSTTATALAKTLRVPFIPLDPLFHNPGWVQSSREEFQARLHSALGQNERGWVVDGNYFFAGTEEIVQEMATDIIWLDPPLYVYLPRVIWRTFMRILRIEPPCAPGCFETLKSALSRDGIIMWCITAHSPVRKRNQETMRLVGIEQGTDVARRRMRRFGGWGGDVKKWLGEVADMVQESRMTFIIFDNPRSRFDNSMVGRVPAFM